MVVRKVCARLEVGGSNSGLRKCAYLVKKNCNSIERGLWWWLERGLWWWLVSMDIFLFFYFVVFKFFFLFFSCLGKGFVGAVMASPTPTNRFVSAGEPMTRPYKLFVGAVILPVPANLIFSCEN